MHIFNLQNQPIPKYEHATFNLVLELYDTKKGTSFLSQQKVHQAQPLIRSRRAALEIKIQFVQICV